MVRGLIYAGSGTVKDTLDWIILLVTAHPDFQVKIQQEIDQTI